MGDDISDVLLDFKRGFARAERELLARSVTADFEWHLHWQESVTDEPTGKVLRGLDQVMAEIERRRVEWSGVSYEDVQERFTEDMIVQTFVVSGTDSVGRDFKSAAVDLYPLRDGLIARKQTYWKQLPPRAE